MCFREDSSLIDHRDTNGAVGASLCAGGRFIDSQPVRAHVAFTNDASFVGILGNVIGAFEDAILAPDALVIEMTHDAGAGVFFISQDRAPIEACRINAMMARGGNGLLKPTFVHDAVEQPHLAPGLVLIQSIETVAGSDTRRRQIAHLQAARAPEGDRDRFSSALRVRLVHGDGQSARRR